MCGTYLTWPEKTRPGEKKVLSLGESKRIPTSVRLRRINCKRASLFVGGMVQKTTTLLAVSYSSVHIESHHHRPKVNSLGRLLCISPDFQLVFRET